MRLRFLIAHLVFLTIIVSSNIFNSTIFAAITADQLHAITDIFIKTYQPVLTPLHQELEFNNSNSDRISWLNFKMNRISYNSYLKPDPNNSDKQIKVHSIFVMGGAIKSPKSTIFSITVSICHEIGHGLGGPPYKKEGASIEGQSDYYAAHICLPRILTQLLSNKQSPILSIPELADLTIPMNILQPCQEKYSSSPNSNFCYYAYQSFNDYIDYLTTFKQHFSQTASFDSPDQTIVSKTNLGSIFYPILQCRLDTLLNGFLGINRPSCWYKSESN